MSRGENFALITKAITDNVCNILHNKYGVALNFSSRFGHNKL